MTIQNLVDLAVNSELKNIAIKSDTEAVIGYMNLGLIELYKRFPLSVQEHLIELQDGVEIYDVPEDFMWMVAAYDEVPEDSVEPVMPIAINEEDNPASINMISYNQVQIPVTVTGAYISLIYIASPRYFTEADLAETLPIPPQMVEALLHYIGYRAHGAMDGNIQAENSTHYQRFELSCKRIEQNGMFTSDDLSMSDRYTNSIWA
jgi:hypothetical protein